jgi:two-component sensor histidine kinase
VIKKRIIIIKGGGVLDLEDKYEMVFNTVNHGIVFRDPKGHVTSFNPKAEELFKGLIKSDATFPKMLDDYVQGTIHDDGTDFPIKIHPSKLALKTGKDIENIVMGFPNNEEYKWFKVTAIPLFQPGELKPYQVYTVVEDVTSLKKSKDLINKTKNRYKRTSKLVNNYAYSVIIDKSVNDLEYEWVVTSFYDILGVSKKYFKSNKNLFFPVHPEDKDKALKQFSNLKDGDKRSEIIRLLTYDRKVIWALNHIKCVKEDGALRVYGGVQDITLTRKYYLKLKRKLEISQSFEHIYTPLILEKSSIKDINSTILKEAQKLTKSKMGSVSVIIPEKNSALMHSNIFILEKSKIKSVNDDSKFQLKNDSFSKFLKESLKIFKGFYTNSPKKDPLFKKMAKYHPLENAMYIPVVVENKILGQIFLTNSTRDYTDADLKTIERLAAFFAIGIQSMESRVKIKKSLKDKELLLKEIHHRVKNNLQIISSLLNLESRNIDNPGTDEFYKKTKARIKAIALVHQKLYETPEITQINTKEHTINLIQNILTIYDSPREIRFNIKIEEDIELNLDTTIPCSLIINELLTNSIKHAFPDNKGNINIKWEQKGEEYILNFSDDGIGLSYDELEKSPNLGLKLVQGLVDQIDGTIKLNRNHGTQYTIKFKELKYKKRI